MSFVAPSILLYLIPLAGIILILYLLKMKRKEIRIPASFLWPAKIYEVRANSLFQRLRVTLLLILQLVALVLLLVAAARPQLREHSLTGQSTVVVIDASASMAATDVQPSRLDQAVADAGKLVDAVRPGDRLSIIEAGPVPRVVSPLSDNPGKLRTVLKSIHVYDTAADVGEALRLASSLVAKSASAKIILLSDGVFPDVKDLATGHAQLVFDKIGESNQNSAISALGATDTNQGPQLYCGLRNYGSKPQNGVLNVYADGDLVNSMKVEIPANGTLGKTMPLPSSAKVVEAKLDDNDYLSADNYAVTLRGNQAISVLLVGPGDLFLERALGLDPRVSLYKSSSVPPEAKYDVVVFDGVPESEVNAKGVLEFGAPGTGSPVTGLGTAAKPTFKDSKVGSTLLRGVDLSGVFINQAQTVKAQARAQTVATGSNGPMIVTSSGDQRHIFVSFAPLASDWPLHVSFPIFIGNALSFLAPANSTSNTFQAQAGRTIEFPAQGGDLRIDAPDSQTEIVRPSNGQYVIRSLDRVGKYVVQGNPQKLIYATFGSDSQSNIAPKDRPNLGAVSTVSVDITSRLMDWWKPIGLLALFALGFEWWVFMRRS